MISYRISMISRIAAFYSKRDDQGAGYIVFGEFHILTLSVLNTHISKTIATDELEPLQVSYLSQIRTALNDAWIAAKDSLQSVGKGWFAIVRSICSPNLRSFSL